MDLLNIFSGGIFGSITGLIGSIATAWMNLKMKRLDLETKKVNNEHKEKMVSLQADAAVKEIEAGIRASEVEVAGDIAKGELAAYIETIKDQSRSLFQESYMKYLSKGKFGKIIAGLSAFSFAGVDVMKATVRPIATYYSLGCATWVSAKVLTVISLETYLRSNPTIAAELLRDIVGFIFYMAMTAFSWWFVDRRLAKYATKFLDRPKSTE